MKNYVRDARREGVKFIFKKLELKAKILYNFHNEYVNVVSNFFKQERTKFKYKSVN